MATPSPGTRLGPYQIIAALGKGGMGEVYKATDTRLDRTVAIKVLPAHVADDPDLRARLEREARTISSLNHPHICTLYDVGNQDGTDFLVMEFLEGDTLASRLENGPLPIDQALRYAIEIADALDKAHRQGIVHRDLKPGNIMLTKGGAKLLDFGLAKWQPGASSSSLAVSAAPTVASPLTGAGSIVGTFQYMAPEQLDGQEADVRSDIFAFGAVLYEMLTGRKAFEGRSQASLIHAIMGANPRLISEVQPVAPRSLDHLVNRCLAKAPDDRWQTARDIHQELRWVLDQLSAGPDAAAAAPPPASPTRAWRLAVPAAVLSLIAGAAVTAVILRSGTGPSATPAVTSLDVMLAPVAASLGLRSLQQLDISRDGRTIAFAGTLPSGNRRGIFIRALGAREPALVPGTEADVTFDPVLSPDGNWIAYRTLQGLFKVPIDGGRPMSIGPLRAVTAGVGISWSADGWIYYTENVGQASGSLLRVSADGGPPEHLLTLDRTVVNWPKALGDGRYVTFGHNQGGAPVGSDSAQISLLDTETRDTRLLSSNGGAAPTVAASGHLVFVRDSRLFAMPFDRDRLEVTGAPREVLGGVQYDLGTGATSYAIADNGTLVYERGSAPRTAVMWADASGARQAFPDEQTYYDPRLSPDGRAVAAEMQIEGDDVWVLDLTRGTRTKISQGQGESETPAWSPDGRWIAWSADRDGARAILRKRADGSGAENVLWTGSDHTHVSQYTPDGQALIFEKQTAVTNTDIYLLPLDGSGAERLLLGTAFNEFGARLSPDGRWLAYGSDESGVSQVYVRPFPGLDARFQISRDGGGEPVWARDGRQLFYRGETAMWGVSIKAAPAFEAGIPEQVFENRYQSKAVTHTGYDVAADGQFLVIGDTSPPTQTLSVVLNWFEDLKRLVPAN